MAYELIYTSAERGLKPGTRGFCTVAHTRGMTPQNVQFLEALSAYKNLYGMHEEHDANEPVAWSHVTNNLLGHTASVISRVGATAADHTGRSNKLAHHVLISSRERAAGGPAWLSMQEGFLLDAWNEQPHYIEEDKLIPTGDYAPGRADNWERITGDAAYAAFLPETSRSNPNAIVIVVFSPGMDMLPLISESLALVPQEQRWRVTYNTYFTSLPVGATCSWRCCVADSDALREARRNPRSIVLDLTGPLPPPPSGEYAEKARKGWDKKIEVKVEKQPVEKEHKFVLMNNRNVNMLNLKPRRTL